jgi:beta-xylosidase
MFMRFRNMRHIVRVHVSADGRNWKRFERTFEVSGYHHNVRGGFMSLKPAYLQRARARRALETSNIECPY